ncbi:hypothetical protein H8N03_25905 [Ramlibacter sp. USB13]|uniref:Uncharacterized protein n=2 Tax=Ramlibacter cellulosilyticus TaxID=2764187 RepID=A0A923MZ75_9BURK|nr:hypothetical protein [Ramlibacter cellulosilyticus]
MGQKLSERELALYRAVDEVLHYIWDPIGVAGAPGARDEYYGYLPTVYGMVKDGREALEIARYLGEVAVEGMGLSPDAENDLKVAQTLVQWREAIGADEV